MHDEFLTSIMVLYCYIFTRYLETAISRCQHWFTSVHATLTLVSTWMGDRFINKINNADDIKHYAKSVDFNNGVIPQL